jgi:glycosyltransferase involved in cell wall biosynthesis
MSRLRVALVAGTLGRGGAEKQLAYMAGALAEAGADVRVYALTSGEHYHQALSASGIAVTHVGQVGSPAVRAMVLAGALARFRPQVVQAGHFYVNLHTVIAGRLSGAAPIGSIRSDLGAEFARNGAWGRRLLSSPPDIITNSWCARRAAEAAGRDPATVHVVPNVLDLGEFDRAAATPAAGLSGGPVAMAVGSLRPVKRIDRFLRALALARRRTPVTGVVVGDGPERGRLERLAAELGLGDGGVRFLGERSDVPALLAAAGFLVLTSDHEGVPNVVLEAMAAGRPVIATACGDVDRLVVEGTTGYLVPFDDTAALAERMERLAASPALRHRMGGAGREAVEGSCSCGALADRLLATYQAISRRGHRPRLAAALA